MIRIKTPRLIRKRTALLLASAAVCGLALFGGASRADAVNPPQSVVVEQLPGDEGTGGSGQLLFKVSVVPGGDQPTNVFWETVDDPGADPTSRAKGGSACGGVTDYVTASNRMAIVPATPAGQTEPASTTIAVDTCGDDHNELDETFVIRFQGGPDFRATLRNDDPLPSLTVARADTGPVVEGNSGTRDVAITVKLAPASGQTVRVQPTVTGGGALGGVGGTQCGPGVDFENVQPDLQFDEGETTKTVTVHVCGDSDREPNGTFSVGLTDLQNATLGSPHTAAVTIVDDDTPPTISIGNATTVEGDPSSFFFHLVFSHTVQFTVSLSQSFGEPITIPYGTAAGTATPGWCLSPIRPDYLGVSAGTLTIPAYQRTGVISIEVCNDQLVEPDETFFVDLGTPSAGVFGTHRATGTILNDD